MERITKYVAEMDTGAMIYVLSFIKIGSDFETLTRIHSHVNTQMNRQYGDRMSMFLNK
jgi:hypothetical protein